jgi:type I restriction enzyme S subunit
MSEVIKPRIRIADYNKDWQKKPFGEMVMRSSASSASPFLPHIEYEDIVSGRGYLNKDPLDKINILKQGLLFQSGDLLFGKLRAYLQNNILATFQGIAVGDFWVLRPKENGNFLFNLIKTEQFKKIANTSIGTKMPRSDWELVSTANYYIPEIEEQKDIARIIDNIEISMQKCELELLKLTQTKKAYRSMLFPRLGEKRPRLRFKGFKEDWDTAPLSDYLTIRTDICGNDYTINDVLSVSGDYGVVNQIAFQGRSFAGASIANYRVVNIGNVIYTKSPLKANPYGIIKAAKKEEGVVSPLYAVYNTTDKGNANFIQVFFDEEVSLNNYLRPLVNKGAKNTLLISDSTAISGMVTFPKIEEQRAIADFFVSLDTLIQTNSRRLEQLKRIKSACLDGMFVNE